MIQRNEIDWDQVAVHSQKWVSVEVLKEAIDHCMKYRGPHFFKTKDESKVEAWVESSQGVLFTAKDQTDKELVRKLSLVNLKLAEDFGIEKSTTEPEGNQGRPCPKCGGAFRVSRVNQHKAELVCANPNCRYAVMETSDGAKTVYTDWGTGQPVKL